MAKFDNQGSHSHITTGDQDSLLVVIKEENDSLIMKQLGNQFAPQEEISKLPIGWELHMALSTVNFADSSELIYATKFGLPSTSHLQVKILKKPELTNDECLALYHYLVEQSNGGKLKRGLVQTAA